MNYIGKSRLIVYAENLHEPNEHNWKDITIIEKELFIDDFLIPDQKGIIEETFVENIHNNPEVLMDILKNKKHDFGIYEIIGDYFEEWKVYPAGPWGPEEADCFWSLENYRIKRYEKDELKYFLDYLYRQDISEALNYVDIFNLRDELKNTTSIGFETVNPLFEGM